jgi:hypothetical protein
MSRYLTLLVLSLLTASAPALASDAGRGWLIYQQPSTDAHYGAILGQARPIVSAWARSGNARIIDVIDQAGDNLTVHFFTEDGAQKFVAAVRAGNSFDVSDCAHPGRFASGSAPEAGGCSDSVYEAEFHCDLLDRVKPVDTSSVDATRFVSPNQPLSVYVDRRDCVPTM